MKSKITTILSFASTAFKQFARVKDPQKKLVKEASIAIEISRMIREHVIPSKILVAVFAKYPDLTYQEFVDAAGAGFPLNPNLFSRAQKAYEFITKYQKQLPMICDTSVSYISALRAVERVYAKNKAEKRFVSDFKKLNKVGKVSGPTAVRKWRVMMMGEL